MACEVVLKKGEGGKKREIQLAMQERRKGEEKKKPGTRLSGRGGEKNKHRGGKKKKSI